MLQLLVGSLHGEGQAGAPCEQRTVNVTLVLHAHLPYCDLNGLNDENVPTHPSKMVFGLQVLLEVPEQLPAGHPQEGDMIPHEDPGCPT